MLESIPDLQNFVRHSFSIHTSEGKKEVSIKKVDLNPAIANQHVIKVKGQLESGNFPVVQTDVTITSGSVTKKSYIKPNLYQLEGKHKLVYHDLKTAFSVIVRTDKYPLLWLYYWISLRTIASVSIARKSLAVAWQQWRLGLGIIWRSLSGLIAMTHDTLKFMVAAIWREWR